MKIKYLVAPIAVVTLASLVSTAQATEPDEVEQLDVEVLERYPHDVEAFTQGFELHDGVLYEGTGQTGSSQMRTLDVESGQVIDSVALPDDVFGEGITVVGDEIWQLTWQSEIAFRRDVDTLAEVGQATYDGPGWGLCHDAAADHLVMSNGQPQLTFRDPDTFDELGSVDVTLDGEPFSQINELECVAGKVWANVWPSDEIVRIDPGSGAVEAVVDASGLLTDDEAAQADVLNGIAHDADSDTFLITGKRWPWTFRVEFV